MSRDIYQLLRVFGGISLEYLDLVESDFADIPLSPYIAPERGDFRRIVEERVIQLLQDAPGVIETFQTSSAELRLPANTIAESTNDAGNGRLFFLKNSGTGQIVVKNYLGNTLWTIQNLGIVIVVGNDNDNWDFYFTAKNINFNPEPPFISNNVQDAIVEAYLAAKGIKTFPFELHFVSGTGLNTSMSNGSFFRVRPGTFASGSYSGYPSAFPLQMPFDCKLYSIILTFREASFDFNSTPGGILFELEFRVHYYNGSDVKCRVLVNIPGEFSGNSTGTDTFRFILHADNFTVIDPLLPNLFEYAEMIGVRFVKAASGDRRINSFRDIVMKLNFEEIIS